MALIVPWAFSEFFGNINLTGDHHGIARARRDRILSILGKEFDILDSMAIGSIPKYTAIRGEADLVVRCRQKIPSGWLASTPNPHRQGPRRGYQPPASHH